MQTLPWLLATYLPIELGYIILVWKIDGGLSHSSLAQSRFIAGFATALAAVVTSSVTVLAGQLWAILLEIVRIGDGHLGYRTQFIPYMQIQFRMFVFGVAAYLVAVLVRRYFALRAADEPILRAFHRGRREPTN